MDQSKVYPIFFILERVENGFILTSKSASSPTIKKEIVAEDRISARIGELLAFGSLKKGCTQKYYFDTVSFDPKTSPNDPANYAITDELFAAKYCFYNFRRQDLKDGSILCINDKDTGDIEIFGTEAEKIFQKMDLTVVRKFGIPVIFFKNDKNGKMCLTKYAGRVTMVELTQKEILEWYHKHKPEA